MIIGILGGAGFIGSHLKTSLEYMGHKVIVIDDFSFMNHERGIDSSAKLKIIEYRQGLISDSPLTSLNEVKNIDYLVNLAADPMEYPFGDKRAIEQYGRDNRTNLEAVLYAKSKNIPYMFMSSVFAIGDFDKPADENIRLNPKTIYGLIKKNGEILANSFNKDNSLIIRTTSVFGYGDLNNRATQIIANNLLNNKPVTINTFARLDFTYIYDLCDRLAELIDKNKTGVYNITGGKCYSLLEYAEKMSKALGVLKPNIIQTYSEDRPNRAELLNNKINKETVVAKYTFDEAIIDYANTILEEGNA